MLTVRRITLNANKVTPDEGVYQVDFFTDTKKLEKEKKLQQAIRKPRASVRKQLSETKQAASPKKAAARSKQHEMEV